jgi:preprotein translocase subunit Sss1
LAKVDVTLQVSVLSPASPSPSRNNEKITKESLMEPNLEPRRRDQKPQNRQLRDQPREPQNLRRETPVERPSVVTVNQEPGQYYVRVTCLFMGVVLLCIGLVGFVMDNFLMAHLTYSHSLIHVVAGVLALGFGYYSNQAARIFSYAAGAVFGILGIAGFIVGQRAMSTVGHIGEDQFLWVLQPETLVFGTADHILHLLYAVVFFAGALFFLRRRNQVTKVSSR